MRLSRVCVYLFIISIFLSARGQDGADLFTNKYTVPPTFFSGALSYESFRSSNAALPRRATAKEVLQRVGIRFGEHASAIYNPSTSTLIVRNTKQELELVEAYIDTIRLGADAQIYVTVKELFFPTDSYDSFFEELGEDVIQHLPWIADTVEENPERGFFAGSLPDPQTQLLIRKASENDSLTLNANPSFMVRGGQPGTIEMKQFRFGVTTHLKQQRTQVTFSLYLPPPGENLIRDPNSLAPDVKGTVWDGNTAVIKKSAKDGMILVLVQFQVMDPAGQNINPDGGLRGLLKRMKKQ